MIEPSDDFHGPLTDQASGSRRAARDTNDAQLMAAMAAQPRATFRQLAAALGRDHAGVLRRARWLGVIGRIDRADGECGHFDLVRPDREPLPMPSLDRSGRSKNVIKLSRDSLVGVAAGRLGSGLSLGARRWPGGLRAVVPPRPTATPERPHAISTFSATGRQRMAGDQAAFLNLE